MPQRIFENQYSITYVQRPDWHAVNFVYILKFYFARELEVTLRVGCGKGHHPSFLKVCNLHTLPGKHQPNG